MNMSPIGQPGEKICSIRDQTPALRLTAQQFLQLGTDQVVYLRAGIHDGRPLFVLYGADGQPLALAAAVGAAVEMAAEHGLSVVSVH